MSDLSSVDHDLDTARVAFDTGIDGVFTAVQSALDGINAQIERLEGVREALEVKREAVEAEIDVLADRAAQLQALSLPGPVGAASGLAHGHGATEAVYDDELVEYEDEADVEDDVEVEYVEEAVYVDEDGNEVIEIIEYVDEDGNPVDEHGNPLDEHGNPIEYVYEDEDDEVEYVEEISLDDAAWANLELPRTDRLVALVEFHGELTTAEAVQSLADVGDEVSTSTVSASLGNLARQGRITKLDAGLFGPA